MSASNVFENDLMKLIFNGTAIANIADNAATSPNTNLFVSLHTADPGEAGTQSTSEATYTAYARVSVARTSAGWTVTNNVAANTLQINFPEATGGSNSVTHFGIGTSSTGTGKLLFSGALQSALSVSIGITPAFNAGALTINAD